MTRRAMEKLQRLQDYTEAPAQLARHLHNTSASRLITPTLQRVASAARHGFAPGTPIGLRWSEAGAEAGRGTALHGRRASFAAS